MSSRTLHSTSFGLHSYHHHRGITPYERFLETCELSGVQEPQREQIWNLLQQHYTDGARYYHNLDHLMAMFDFVRFATRAGVELQDPAAVDWSVWFHDVIHDPSSKSNEAESAELAGQLLADAGLSEQTINKVQQYILVTADPHPLDADCDMLVDADLSVLGAPMQRYIEYALAVRKEYSHLSDEQYTRERAKRLKSLLDREQLFLTDVGKSACEAAARANMSHEWRLAYAGQLLSANALDERDETVEEGTELPSRSTSLASAGTAGTDPSAAAAAAGAGGSGSGGAAASAAAAVAAAAAAGGSGSGAGGAAS